MMIVRKLKTILAFTKNIGVTGAVTETSKKVEAAISAAVPQESGKVLVEYGMGHGNITQHILDQMSSDSKLYAFEVNKDFCEHVAQTIDDPRLIIVNDGAQNLKKHVKEPIHFFVSTIPFTFFSKELAETIIETSYDALEDGYYFCQVLYSKLHFKKFESVFPTCQLRRVFGLPMEYIYYCQK